MENQTQKELTFPFTDAPSFGEPMPVAKGVYWLRMPLPFTLDHINLWLIEDQDGWNIIDTGVNTQTCKDIWQQVLTQFDKPIKRLFVTHMHPDHAGLAGWLCHKLQISLYMSRTDYLMCRLLVSDGEKPVPQSGISFYQAAGLNQSQLEDYKNKHGRFAKLINPLPGNYVRMEHGQTYTMAGQKWQTIVGKGHAPEQITFLCPTLKLYISGDQLLPNISSNVSVWPTEPRSNPLHDWLVSCANLQECISDDVLVLPAHEKPFLGASTRLQKLQDDHHQDLEKILDVCQRPQRVVDLFPSLFKRKVDDSVLTLAVGETMAHLSYLLQQGLLTCQRDDQGVDWYFSPQQDR